MEQIASGSVHRLIKLHGAAFRMTGNSWASKILSGISSVVVIAATSIILLPFASNDPAASDVPVKQQKSTDWSLISTDCWPILRQTYNEFNADRVLAVAAGVTFYCLLALFPTVSVIVAIYGIFTAKAEITAQIASLSAFLPSEVLPIITDQASRIVEQGETRNLLALVAGLLIAIWSSNSGMKSIIEALNVAYGVTEKRSFLRLNSISLFFTMGAIAGLVLLMTMIAFVPAFLSRFTLPAFLEILIWAGRWPVMFLGLALAFAVLYRFGPSGLEAKWRWLTPGSLLASIGLVAFSMLFSWYATSFGHYNETYGTVGAAISFMTWVWMSSVIVLIGAELNAELDRRLEI